MKRNIIVKIIEIIKASTQAKVIAGVIGVAVAGGAVAGGVAIYKSHIDKPVKVESMAEAMGDAKAAEAFEKDNATNSKEYLEKQEKDKKSDSKPEEKESDKKEDSSNSKDSNNESKETSKNNDLKVESNSGSKEENKSQGSFAVKPKEENKSGSNAQSKPKEENKSGSNAQSKPKEEHKSGSSSQSKPKEEHKSESSSQSKPKEENKVDNQFKGFTYSMSGDGSSYNKIGGDNNYAAEYPQLSSKSTVKGLVPDVNRAVQVLTQGAYENKVRSKFLGKIYNGKKITGVDIKFYEIPIFTGDELTDMNKALKQRGAFNTPGGSFASVIGGYTPINNDEVEGFVKCTVILN